MKTKRHEIHIFRDEQGVARLFVSHLVDTGAGVMESPAVEVQPEDMTAKEKELLEFALACSTLRSEARLKSKLDGTHEDQSLAVLNPELGEPVCQRKTALRAQKAEAEEKARKADEMQQEANKKAAAEAQAKALAENAAALAVEQKAKAAAEKAEAAAVAKNTAAKS